MRAVHVRAASSRMFRRIAAAVAFGLGLSLVPATAASAQPTPEGPGPTGEITYPVIDLEAPVEELEFGTATISGGVKEEGDEITLAGEVLFDPNKHTLSDEAAEELDQLVASLMDHDPQQLTVVGHTDDVQSAEHNQALSERRAETIAGVLEDELGDGVTIEASGKGETEPIADNETEDGRALNRRVVVTVVK